MPQNTLRLAAFLAGLLTFLSWEMIAPHHAATASKPRRWLVNLGLALLNGLIVTSLCAACYAIALRRMLPWRVGLFELTAAPSWLRLPAEIGALDLLTYWLHRGYHRVPLLWRFHRVHHTDLDLDVSSASRFHFGEVMASSIAKLAFVALLGISYQGLVAFEIVLLLAAQFQHANIGVHPRLEPMLWWTLVPPAMHRVHHSPEPEETDSNFGTLLVAWDRLFATFRTHTALSPPFGLWNWRDERRLGFGKMLALPFFRGCATATEGRAGIGLASSASRRARSDEQAGARWEGIDDSTAQRPVGMSPEASAGRPGGLGRPGGVTALAIFFAAGAAVCLVSCVALLFPGGVLEPIWRLNPRARAGFASLGAWAPVLLAVVGLACAAAARGLWTGRRWGWGLAMALLAVNLVGDTANALLGTEPRALVGIQIVVLVLLFLATGRVRAYFAERPAR